MVENVLYVATDRELEYEVDIFNDVPFAGQIEVKQFFIFVPNLENGKVIGWLTSDPDNEEVIFNKDFALAYEFKTLDHARRARTAVSVAGMMDAFIFGDII